jgi:hypothetical protein
MQIENNGEVPPALCCPDICDIDWRVGWEIAFQSVCSNAQAVLAADGKVVPAAADLSRSLRAITEQTDMHYPAQHLSATGSPRAKT